MPARQPFTYLCQTLARGPKAGRADLHLHTTASDGNYRPEEVVDLARRCGLAAVAITDHDTLAGVAPARAAAPASLEVIAGVEITTEHLGRELHLLGYFVDDNADLDAALADVRASRVERYRRMIERLRAIGVSVEDEAFAVVPDALGRRHLAEMLVRQGKAGSVREAFQRWLGDGAPAALAKRRIPIGEAIRLVRAAGGVASWAHPSYDGARQHLADLAALGPRRGRGGIPGPAPVAGRPGPRLGETVGVGDHRRQRLPRRCGGTALASVPGPDRRPTGSGLKSSARIAVS